MSMYIPEQVEKEFKKLRKSICCNSLPKTKDVDATTYTLIKTDASKILKTTSGSATTINIPLNSSVAFPVGTIIFVEQWGAGQVTFDPAVGVTLNSEGGADKLAAQYGGAYIRKDDTNTWILIGNITV